MRASVLVAALVAVLASAGCYHEQTAAAPARPQYTWVQGHYYWDSPTQKWLWRDGYWAAGYQAQAPQPAESSTTTYVGVGLGVGYPYYSWGPYYGWGYPYYGYYGYPRHYGYGVPHYRGPVHGPVVRPSPAPRPNFRIPSAAPRAPSIHITPRR